MGHKSSNDKLVTCEIDGILYRGRNSIYMTVISGKEQVFIDGKRVGIDCDECGNDIRQDSHGHVAVVPLAECLDKSRWQRFLDFFMGSK